MLFSANADLNGEPRQEEAEFRINIFKGGGRTEEIAKNGISMEYIIFDW